MPEIRRFFSRLITFFRAGKADSDLTREINAHLQLLEDQFLAKGMTPEEAGYAAKRAFGGVEQAKERQRDTRTFAWLAGWSMDLKLGVRMLVKTPGLTIIAVIALALGIGAGASYFEFVNDLFRAKPSFPGAERLVGLLNWDLAKANVEDRSVYEFAAWKMQLTTVEELGAARDIREGDLITEDGRSQPARGWEISASAFRVVPIPPLYGRPLLDDDEKPGATDVVVIGEDLWKARFNSDPLVIGRTVRFDETIRTVVGVMPHSFGFPFAGTLWTPLRLDAARIKRGEGPPIRIFGRLAPGAELDQARAELETIAGRMPVSVEAGRANPTPGMRPSIHPYVESFWVDFSRGAMNTLFLVVYSFNILFIAFLGICAANVAQLIFARTAARESEITVRTALGASRARIVAQLIAEALVLASVAAIVGLAGASAALQKAGEMFHAMTNSGLPFWWNEQLGIETIAYSGLLVIIAALLIGGIPALRATGPQMNARLKEAGAGGATMRFGKLWTGVIVAQVAVTVILLLVIVSLGWYAYLQSGRAVEVAFSRSEYLTAGIRLEAGATAEREKAVRRELLRRLNADPDVINATFAVELVSDIDMDEFWLELPSTSAEGGQALRVHEPSPIGWNHFETFQQPLIAGRLFTGSEIEEGRNVAIVDETFVRLVLGGKSAIGQLVRESGINSNGKPGPWLEIVGVVKDITLAPNKTMADAILYQPAAPGRGSFIVVHSRSNEAAARVRAAVTATDPQIRLDGMMTIDRRDEAGAQQASFIMTALGIITAVTLMLAAAGIHSLISFTLVSRTREIGIRTALGAAPVRIVTSMLSPTFMKIGIGIVLGSIPGIAFVWETLDWGISFQMVVMAAVFVALFIIAVVMISCIWPVRRALKIQPTEALRTT